MQLGEALGAPDVRYLLLEAPTEQAVLALSEQLEARADALVARHAVDAVELPSRYLPSAATQRLRQGRLPDRATLEAAVQKAAQGLPFRPHLFQPFVDDVQVARLLPPLTPQRFAQTALGQRLAEYGAQAAAVHGALCDRARGVEAARPGRIASLRGLELAVEYVDGTVWTSMSNVSTAAMRVPSTPSASNRRGACWPRGAW